MGNALFLLRFVTVDTFDTFLGWCLPGTVRAVWVGRWVHPAIARNHSQKLCPEAVVMRRGDSVGAFVVGDGGVWGCAAPRIKKHPQRLVLTGVFHD